MKKVLAIIVLLILVGGAAFALTNRSDNRTNTSGQDGGNQQATEITEPSENPEEFTTAQVAEHSSASDCWLIIRSKVYDVTDFISQHPGGNEILRGCGKDATTLFETRQTEDGESVGSGSPHSASAESMLQDYFIGNLAE